MKNSRIILPLLAIGVVAAFYYAWQNTPRVQRVVGNDDRVEISADSTVVMNEEMGRFDFSGGEQRKFTKPERNLFNLLYPPPPAPKQHAPVAPVVPPAPIVAAPPAPPPVPVPAPVPIRQMPPFQVVGFLEKGTQLTAFVSLQGEIYLVKKNQSFADEFRVADLNREAITIVRVAGEGEVSLPLSDKSGVRVNSGGAAINPTAQPRIQLVRPRNHPAMPIVSPPREGDGQN